MGKNEKRLLGALLLGATTALLITGCTSWVNDETFADDNAVTGPITAVRLDLPVGDVHVRVEDGASASLHREVTYRGDRPGTTHRLEGGTLVLAGCDNNCGVRYDLVLPSELAVTGTVGTGRIDIDRAASADLRSSTGDVKLERISGAVTVSAGTGRVNVGLSKPASVRVEANTGAVTVAVPQASYRVSAHSDVGSTSVDVPQDPSSANWVDVSSNTGRVTVKNA
ncbi:DUF4097 family beta strand repeat-containing protein [Amycolatopsis sp.]|jgi:hypothetical protein|uniref:DUF4097 family beta strand repeat-containing protein n=1 Tax=Amycolatopsis sp. TaxID=37632 RepID=UPI002E0886B1|nr:DUF4097 family beta strand repeat-containing protein [Amycolatopsis sp.]